MTSKELLKLLRKEGWKEIRQKGSHKILMKNDKKIVVPIHNKDIPKGTLEAIMRQSGLK